MKPVQAYKCDFCSRCFTRPASTANHEVACKNNPKRKMCITCTHCKIKEDRTVVAYEFLGENIYNDSPTCTILNISIQDKPYFIEEVDLSTK